MASGKFRDLKWDVSDFNQMLDQLADEAGKNGFSTKEIIEGEAATTLASAADLTEKADSKQIDKRYSLRRVPKSGKNAGINPNTDPGLIPFVKVNGKWYSTQNRYPTPVFSQIQKKLNYYKQRAKKRIYSAKAVWLLTAREAGVFTGRFKSGTKLDAAIAAQKGGYDPANSGRRSGGGRSFTITIKSSNTVLLNRHAKGDFAIRSAMARRQRYFETNMEKGAMKTADRIAKAYPGVVLKGRRGAPEF